MIDIEISKLTIADSVSRQIKELIIQKKLNDGDKLPSQRELAAHLRVGRPSIREALHKLEALGIVRVSHGKNTTVEKVSFDKIMLSLSEVLELTPTDVLQLLEAKEIVETQCVALAIGRATKEELEEMEKHIEEMKQYRRNPSKHAEADFLFHFTIVKSAKNPIITEIMKMIGKMMLKAIEETALEDDISGRDQAMVYHRALYRAIREKNKKEAVLTLHRHSVESRQQYKAMYSIHHKMSVDKGG